MMKRLSCLTRVDQHQSFSLVLKALLALVIVLAAGYPARAQQSPTQQPSAAKPAPSQPAKPQPNASPQSSTSVSPQAIPLPQSTPFAGPSPSVVTPPPMTSETPAPLVSAPASMTNHDAQGSGLLTLDEALRLSNALSASRRTGPAQPDDQDHLNGNQVPKF